MSVTCGPGEGWWGPAQWGGGGQPGGNGGIEKGVAQTRGAGEVVRGAREGGGAERKRDSTMQSRVTARVPAGGRDPSPRTEDRAGDRKARSAGPTPARSPRFSAAELAVGIRRQTGAFTLSFPGTPSPQPFSDQETMQ